MEAQIGSDPAHDLALLAGHQRDAGSVAPRAAGATHAVNVGVAVLGGVEVDDVRDVVHVDSACRHVGGDQRVDRAGVEARERLLTLGLRAIAVDRQGVHAVTGQALHEPVGAALGAHEDERATAVASAELGHERVQLRLVGHRQEAVLHAPSGALARPLLVAAGVVGEGGGDLAGGAFERGREEQRLAVPRGQPHDPVDRRAEAHVEHPIRLVENEEPDGVESDGAALHEVLEATGCGHQDVRPAGKLRLPLDAGAPVDGCERQRPRLGELAQVVRDLARELPRRHQDEGGRPPILGLYEVHERHAEGQRLAGPCR